MLFRNQDEAAEAVRNGKLKTGMKVEVMRRAFDRDGFCPATIIVGKALDEAHCVVFCFDKYQDGAWEAHEGQLNHYDDFTGELFTYRSRYWYMENRDQIKLPTVDLEDILFEIASGDISNRATAVAKISELSR